MLQQDYSKPPSKVLCRKTLVSKGCDACLIDRVIMKETVYLVEVQDSLIRKAERCYVAPELCWALYRIDVRLECLRPSWWSRS